MADEAKMPKPGTAKPRNWLIATRCNESSEPQWTTVADAKLASADAGWIKFLGLDGRITMFATANVICAKEQRDP